MRPRVAAPAGLAVLPVLWAAVTAQPGRLTAGEAAAYLLLLGVGIGGAARFPASALALTTGGWAVALASRLEVDGLLGGAVLAAGLLVVALLAGRSARSGPHAVAVLVAAPLVVAAVALWADGGADTALGAGLGVGVLSVVPWTLGRHLRRHDELVRAGWERAQLWEREAERAVEVARLRERDRLAGEMHDLIGHELAKVALGVGAMEVDPALAAEHRAAAGRVREGVTAAAERLADVVRMLRSDATPGDEGSVAELLERARRAGVAVTVTAGPTEPDDPVIAATVHRVVAEALTNAMKHAPGAAVRVAVDRGGVDQGGDAVLVRVDNDAAADPPPVAPPGGGSGLAGLTERVRLVGGRITTGPTPDGGWSTTAELPAAPGTPTRASDTERHRRHAEDRVHRSGRRAALVVAAVAVVGTASVAGYMVLDAATSVLPPAVFDRLQPGAPRSAVAPLLPARTRTDGSATEEPPSGTRPAGTVCEHYSTHANPFDERRGDLFRLCFADGVLVGKDLLVRSGDGSTTAGR